MVSPAHRESSMIREVKLGQVRHTPELMFDLVLSFKRLCRRLSNPRRFWSRRLVNIPVGRRRIHCVVFIGTYFGRAHPEPSTETNPVAGLELRPLPAGTERRGTEGKIQPTRRLLAFKQQREIVAEPSDGECAGYGQAKIEQHGKYDVGLRVAAVALQPLTLLWNSE